MAAARGSGSQAGTVPGQAGDKVGRWWEVQGCMVQLRPAARGQELQEKQAAIRERAAPGLTGGLSRHRFRPVPGSSRARSKYSCVGSTCDCWVKRAIQTVPGVNLAPCVESQMCSCEQQRSTRTLASRVHQPTCACAQLPALLYLRPTAMAPRASSGSAGGVSSSSLAAARAARHRCRRGACWRWTGRAASAARDAHASCIALQ